MGLFFVALKWSAGPVSGPICVLPGAGVPVRSEPPGCHHRGAGGRGLVPAAAARPHAFQARGSWDLSEDSGQAPAHQSGSHRQGTALNQYCVLGSRGADGAKNILRSLQGTVSRDFRPLFFGFITLFLGPMNRRKRFCKDIWWQKFGIRVFA